MTLKRNALQDAITNGLAKNHEIRVGAGMAFLCWK
jgi:hypothetical protein